ncbi:zf-HC2 domain-containing protein [Streptomyces sp. I05A-00742]|uniref:anti-sigma factor family protein n=1 Tax=Streptomyces sp. I05A-00742 TaxID=2732853 RepID=UPI00148808FA|nr:zf-HC2 domain-containing protein [Streptomyces sp. I05A-00742]
MTGSGGQSPAEQHLGDRLAALVDGELGHDARERVLAHLATCWTCKAEADAQRRLKSMFAEAPPPPLSDALLARLQSLPAMGLDGPAGPGAPTADGEERAGEPGGPGGPGRDDGFGPHGDAFALLPMPALAARDRGFRVHDVGRNPSRGRRFAFAAAGAVTIAAFALVGAEPLRTAVEAPRARSENPRTSTATALALSAQGNGGGVRSGGNGESRRPNRNRPVGTGAPADAGRSPRQPMSRAALVIPPALPVAVPYRMPQQAPLAR